MAKSTFLRQSYSSISRPPSHSGLLLLSTFVKFECTWNALDRKSNSSTIFLSSSPPYLLEFPSKCPFSILFGFFSTLSPSHLWLLFHMPTLKFMGFENVRQLEHQVNEVTLWEQFLKSFALSRNFSERKREKEGEEYCVDENQPYFVVFWSCWMGPNCNPKYQYGSQNVHLAIAGISSSSCFVHPWNGRVESASNERIFVFCDVFYAWHRR